MAHQNRFHEQIEWVPTGDPATVDMTRNPYPGNLGGIYTAEGAGQWQLVQGDSTMAVAPFPGALMWWRTHAHDAFLVTTDPTGRRGRVAGVVARRNRLGVELAAGPAAGHYFFIQKGGRAVVKSVDVPTANPGNAGQFVIPSATAGKVDVLAAGAAATYPVVGTEAGWYNIAAREAYVDLTIDDRED